MNVTGGGGDLGLIENIARYYHSSINGRPEQVKR